MKEELVNIFIYVIKGAELFNMNLEEEYFKKMKLNEERFKEFKSDDLKTRKLVVSLNSIFHTASFN